MTKERQQRVEQRRKHNDTAPRTHASMERPSSFRRRHGRGCTALGFPGNSTGLRFNRPGSSSRRDGLRQDGGRRHSAGRCAGAEKTANCADLSGMSGHSAKNGLP